MIVVHESSRAARQEAAIRALEHERKGQTQERQEGHVHADCSMAPMGRSNGPGCGQRDHQHTLDAHEYEARNAHSRQHVVHVAVMQ